MLAESPFMFVFLGFFITGLASGWWLYEFNTYLKLGDPLTVDSKDSHIPYYKGFYAAEPGSGPAGESCQTCANRVFTFNLNGKRFPKCKVVEKYWTHGEVTDIQSSTPACHKWVKIGTALVKIYK